MVCEQEQSSGIADGALLDHASSSRTHGCSLQAKGEALRTPRRLAPQRRDACRPRDVACRIRRTISICTRSRALAMIIWHPDLVAAQVRTAECCFEARGAVRPTRRSAVEATACGQIGSATRAVPAAIARGSSTATGSTAEAATPLWLPLRWETEVAPRAVGTNTCARVCARRWRS